VRVELAGAELLPFEDDEFDVALAQLVVNFMDDPRAGVGEMRRVTRPGGTVAAAVWDYGGEMTLLRKFWDAAAAVNPSGAGRDERNMRMATPDELSGLWSEVGLVQVQVSEAVVGAAYDSFDDLWQPLELGVGPAGAYAASLGPALRDALKSDLRGRLGVDDKPFELTARAWIVSGRVG
jgi:SAM-dependent methyltransferase